jgi:tyrosyl-tRNA synthetase
VNAYDILAERGFFYQLTNAEATRERLECGPVTFYVGFDPTGNSLHIGHLLPVMAMRWMQKCGHRALALVGGATAMVGDPSGKSEARPIMTREQINGNVDCIKSQLSRFLDFSGDHAKIVNNADWLAPLNYIDFLRDTGRFFSINRMLSAESVKQRLETGLSFLEFNYMLLQAYDFCELSKTENCLMQLGGQDQWGNIVAGVDLTRRMTGKEVYGATFPLLLKADGEKFGKTAGGAVWLDPERTSPYEYFQFWRNTADSEVARLLAFFTALPMDEVNRLGALEAPAINRAKEILAYEATTLAHGPEEARKAYLAAGAEFGFADSANAIPTSSEIRTIQAKAALEQLPTHSVASAELAEGIWIVKLLADSGLCASNGDARRLLKGGGCYINDERIDDDKLQLNEAHFDGGSLILRAGKKKIRRIVIG